MRTYTPSLLILRLILGASLLSHGLVRLPKIAAFAAWMTGLFEKSLLPAALVSPFAHALPFIEFATGLCLVLGVARRAALIVTGALMAALIFGSGLIENWEAIPSQMIHGAFAAVLLNFSASDSLSLDAWIASRRTASQPR